MAQHHHNGNLSIGGFLDLLKGELRNARLQNLASPPSSPVVGQWYFDTTENAPGVYTGGGEGWVYLGPSDEAPPGYTDAQAKAVAATLLVNATKNGITLSYDEGTGVLTATVTDSPLLEGEDGAFYLDRTNHTGNITTAVIGDFTTAVEALVQSGVSELTENAPELLDTLAELAAAIGDDPDFSDNVLAAIGSKAGIYKTTIGDGSETSFDIEHGLGEPYPEVVIYNTTTGQRESCEVTSVDANNLTLSGWATAPTSGQYAVRVIG